MTLSTSVVAACCCRASFSSRAIRVSFFFSETKAPLRERRGSDRLGRSALVRSSPKHDELWSRSPVVNAGQIGILVLAGVVPLPRLGAISAVLLRLCIWSYRTFSKPCVSWFTLALSAERRIRRRAAAKTLPSTGHTTLKNVHWGRAGQQTVNWPRLLKRRRNAGCTAGRALWPLRQRLPPDAGSRSLESHPLRVRVALCNISGRVLIASGAC